jgi:hypothetical protein
VCCVCIRGCVPHQPVPSPISFSFITPAARIIFGYPSESSGALPDLALVLSLVSWRCLPVTRISAPPNLRWRANAS